MAARALLNTRLARAGAQKLLDQAQMERTAAQRDMERYQSGFDEPAR